MWSFVVDVDVVVIVLPLRYVDKVLEMISIAGDHVGEEVWHRIVQIVTNNKDLQVSTQSMKLIRCSIGSRLLSTMYVYVYRVCTGTASCRLSPTTRICRSVSTSDE
jgi:hypothetical protein